MRLTRVTPSVFYSTQADYITASLLGTSSWAITASYALNGGTGTGGGYILTSSATISPNLDFVSQTFVSNGTQSVYTLNSTVKDNDDVLVFINGITQIPSINYTASGSTLTLNGIPSSGSNIEVRTINYGFTVSATTSSLAIEYFTSSGAQTVFTRSVNVNVEHDYDVLVSLDGLIQKPTSDYYVTGSFIIFTTPPPQDTDIEVRYLSPFNMYITSGSAGGGGGTGAGFPFSGSAVITGSLTVTEDLTVEGNADFGPPLIFTSSIIDWSIKSAFEKMISTNEIYTFTGVTTGSSIIVILSNTGSSSVTVTFPNDVIWANSLVPTAILPGAVSAYNFFKTNYYLLGSSIENYQ